LKPIHQRIAKWIFFILVGIASAGTLLDAVSNAVSLVSPSFTYISSAILLTLWVLTELAAILFGIPWVASDNQRVRLRSLGPKLRLGLLGILILLWIPRLGDIPSQRNDIPPVSITLSNQTDTEVSVSRRGEFVLWLPTALYDGAPRVGGRFVFTMIGESGYLDSPIIVPAKSNIKVNAELLGHQQFIRFLEREDTDLTFMARTNQGISSSPTIPFSRAALTSRYIEWELTSP
jgi:hypothetical protein